MTKKQLTAEVPGMKKLWWFSLVLIALVSTSTNLVAMEAPREIVQKTTDQVVTRIKNDRDALRQNPTEMFNLVSELIFPHFDFPIMAQWVLGTHWKGASEDMRQEFIQQFRKLLVRTYAAALLEFSDQAITYPDDTPPSNGRTAVVKQEIEQTGSEPIALGYRLHNTSGDWKVLDVSVDGVSLVKTYRASFSSMIRDGGLPNLIESLSEKNKEIGQ